MREPLRLLFPQVASLLSDWQEISEPDPSIDNLTWRRSFANFAKSRSAYFVHAYKHTTYKRQRLQSSKIWTWPMFHCLNSTALQSL